ncbi:universal stress protein UspA [Knoellia aerolata DSM 18566]|uniref:Universal stress protein UspA n=2 Tax=Knoellia TaxID=136099 RepID=A0A0A0JVF0_9MICO|nr:universal stress protein UspA [Knoellia aerolata DSM 18566]
MYGPVVVGYDESAEAGSALRWAADWASARGAALVVVYAVSPPPALTWSSVSLTPTPDVLGRAAQRIAQRGADEARRRHPDLETRALGAVGSPAAELVAMSQSADLVVVGRRVSRADTSLGSVSFALGMHARCPVTVVQGSSTEEIGPGRPVVVGVDTSQPSTRALKFAASAASATGAELVVVSAWSGPRQEPWMADLWPDSRTAAARLSDGASGRAADSLQEAVLLVDGWFPDVRVVTRAPHGLAQEVLLEESEGAGLLVVGSRGQGGFAGLELGSVSRAILREADLPVAVVRDSGI